MNIPRSLKCDENGDLDFSEHQGHLTSSLKEYVAQALEQKLSFFLHEWFLDVRKGMPYFQYVIGVKNPDLEIIKGMFARAILEVRGVASIRSMTLNLDNATRKLKVDFSVNLTNGEILGSQTVV